MEPLWIGICIGVAWLAVCLLGGYAAIQKGRELNEGFFLALIFGPLGVIVEALLPTIEASLPGIARPEPPVEPVPMRTGPSRRALLKELDAD